MTIWWRQRAEVHLKSASSYCARVSGQRAAIRFIESIDHQSQLLIANPYLGPIEPLLANRKTRYRSLVVHEHYKLIYWVDEPRQTLRVAALWDTRRAPDNLKHQI